MSNYRTLSYYFILNNFIEEQIRNRKKLYCCFVDFRKAYDLINRNSLWYKMIKEGIDGKIFKVSKSLYSDIKLCVRHMNSVSDFFASDIGLLQGEITSPILFSLFVNDIELSLQYNINAGLSLCIYLLLFADDAVLMSETREGLQMSLIQLEEYCLKWNLYVNVEKTKIMIFRKGGVLNKLDKWFVLCRE